MFFISGNLFHFLFCFKFFYQVRFTCFILSKIFCNAASRNYPWHILNKLDTTITILINLADTHVIQCGVVIKNDLIVLRVIFCLNAFNFSFLFSVFIVFSCVESGTYRLLYYLTALIILLSMFVFGLFANLIPSRDTCVLKQDT